jgi:Fe-Mn family superoxide dismutase
MAVAQSHLPYGRDALEPSISRKTMSYHYDEHHGGYVRKLNALVEGTDYDEMSVEQIIIRARKEAEIDILNNAAQVWNHGFLWKSMSPNGGRKPEGRIKEMIEAQFGGIDDFKRKFREAALGLFGSGWVWVVLDQSRIRIMTTGNADTPVGTGLVPLLTLDVWEHAYYLDYQNVRAEYVDAFLDTLINWNFAAENLVEDTVPRVA